MDQTGRRNKSIHPFIHSSIYLFILNLNPVKVLAFQHRSEMSWGICRHDADLRGDQKSPIPQFSNSAILQFFAFEFLFLFEYLFGFISCVKYPEFELRQQQRQQMHAFNYGKYRIYWLQNKERLHFRFYTTASIHPQPSLATINVLAIRLSKLFSHHISMLFCCGVWAEVFNVGIRWLLLLQSHR